MKAHNSIEMIGRKFDLLLVLHEVDRLNPKRPRYKCLCDCGEHSFVEGRHLRAGKIKSCGCYAANNLGNRSRTHGLTESPEYKTWCGIKRRCLNKNDKRYPDYGGRVIKISDSWMNSFETFLSDMGERPTEHHSIERIDTNGNYEASNCTWIPMSEQAKNRRSNVILNHNGKSLILSEWAEAVGISSSTIAAILRYGWSIDDALSRKIRLSK